MKNFNYLLVAVLVLLLPDILMGAQPQIPTINLSLSSPDTPRQLVNTLNVILILTLLALAPSLILVMTSFARIAIVFSFLRTALGTQQSPPTQLLVSLALIMTVFIMEPVFNKTYDTAIEPYLAGKMDYQKAFEVGAKPFKEFMVRNTREKDLALFYRIRQLENPASVDDVPLSILTPAFMISELKTAFQIGFLIYLPFLVIDLVVSSVLMAMGMMMLPPVMISLPFKLLVFVAVDGWNLLIQGLVTSFR